LLDDANFDLCSSGVHPSEGGSYRAFFVTTNGLVVYPDADRENTKKTMLGVANTVNGTATSGNTTTLNDTSATFDTTNGLQDCKLWMLSGTNVGLSRAVASNTGTAITCAAFPAAIAAGDRYAVSPIPFEAKYWPLTGDTSVGYPRYLFKRWNVKGMAVEASGYSGEYTGGNGLWTVGAHRNYGTTMSNSATVAMDANPSDSYVAVSLDGDVVEPAITQKGSNIDFELVALQVDGTYTESREAAD
jgi:hypothetical protein